MNQFLIIGCNGNAIFQKKEANEFVRRFLRSGYDCYQMNIVLVTDNASCNTGILGGRIQPTSFR